MRNHTRLSRSPLSPQDPNLYRPNKKYNTVLNLNSKNIKNFPANQFSPIQNDFSKISNSTVLFLELSNNRITSDQLSSIGKNVVSINLSNNPLGTCSLPELNRLRFLNLDNCSLSSFKGFPFLPNLRSLSLQGNPISNFVHCPIFPKLESINITDNLPEKMIIAAFGSIYLKTINRKKIDSDTMIAAFEMSPLIGISLRKGREAIELDTLEDEIKASTAYLTLHLREHLEKFTYSIEPKLIIKQDGDKYVLHCPFESSTYKWYHHTYPDKGSEWKEMNHNMRDLPITVSIRLHMIKCQFQIDGKIFSIYNEEPLGKNENDLSLPYPISPSISGTPIEGSLISVLPIPVPSNIIWTKGTSTIAKDTKSVIIPHGSIGSTISCVLEPHCKYYPEILFSPIFTSTQIISPLLPSVSGIEFPEIIMENETMVFDRTVLPSEEGESEIFMERAYSPSSEWVQCKQLKTDKLEYKPKALDVEHFLRISYTPITASGQKGKATYFYSQTKVLATSPTFKNPVIGGVGKTDYPLVALADYFGGKKGKCTYIWYFSKRPIDSKKGPSNRYQKLQSSNSQVFIPDTSLADCYIACQMIPVRDDDIIGDPVFAAYDQPIQIEEPPKPLLVPDKVVVGERITFEQPVDFLLSKTSGYYGFDFLKTSKSYKPRDKFIGRILRVISKDCDVVLGEIQPAIPKIISVEVKADQWQAGSKARISITHTNCDSDKIEILWLRLNSSFRKAVAINTPFYDLTAEDVGYSIQAIVTPFSYLHEKLEPCYSNITPVIKQEEKAILTIVGNLCEFNEITVQANKKIKETKWYSLSGKSITLIGTGNNYKLTTNDIGQFIKVVATMANDIVLSTSSKETVYPSDPVVEINMPKEVQEDDFITPEIKYTGGTEGNSIKRWYRDIGDGPIHVSDECNYHVTKDDIGANLIFIYIPIRQDQKRGKEVQLEIGPVESLPPSVSNVLLKQNERGYIEVTGNYKGGIEGQSMIVWRTYDENNEPHNIGKTIEKEIMPTYEFINTVVEAGYVPIREDGLGGQPVLSNKITVEPLPIVETAEILIKKGLIMAGNVMRCNAKLQPGCTPLYQWHYGDGKVWKTIENETNVQFTPSDDHAGYYILCSIIAVNSRGWKSIPYAAATSKPLSPSAESLKITSINPIIHSGLNLSTNISAKELRKYKIIWQRENPLNGEWVDIYKNHNDYLVTCNDVGSRLRILDSTGRISVPTNVIQLEPTVQSYVKAMVTNCSLKFIGNPKFGETIWYAAVSSFGVSLESSEKKRKQSKWSLVQAEAVIGTTDEMILWMDPSSKFTLIPSLSHDPRLASLIKKDNVRDFVVSVIKGIKSMYSK